MTTSSTNFDNLDLSSDFMFKHVMLKQHLCKHLLEEILQTKISSLSYIEMEKTLDPYYDSRGIRLDITVADEHNTRFNLEMQVKNLLSRETREALIAKRTRYYQAMLDVDMLQKGQNFDEMPPSFIIFICPFDCFKLNQRIYTFKKRCLENLELELPDEATVIFLNTLGTKGYISNDLQSLYDYINQDVITSKFTQTIADRIIEIKNDKKVRQAYMTYEMRIRDAQLEGKAEGKLEGKTEEKFAIAKRLLAMKLSIQDIATATTLPVVTIKKLQAEMLHSAV